jgi:FKBP-type peptidyl-prolyl cis-trans isomerase FkpA
MNCSWTNAFVLSMACLFFAGCESGDPNKAIKPIPKPKEDVRLDPGPVDQDAPEEFTKTESGLKYRIRRKSEGKKPTAENSVRVHYRGTLDDGKIFDSSYGKSGKAIQFPLKGVVAGWTEGLQLIGEGGMIELEIPPELGYGEKGQGSEIPANATLHFIVELLEVK